MKISTIICTHNRAKLLDETIASYYCMDLNGVDAELLVVDNASQDNTRKLIENWQTKHPAIRYEFEPKLGLSYARNCGISHAQGDIYAFVDDDVYFSKNWLQEVNNTFGNPDALCMGGCTIPVFEDGEPSWLTKEILPVYGATCLGEQTRFMEYPEHPFGVNMAFRREVFDLVGKFNPSLGRQGNNLLSNEESELFWRIHRAGIKPIYNPNAIIYHRIPKERATLEWVLRRYYWQGRSESILDHIVHEKSNFKMLIEFWTRLSYATKSTFSAVNLYQHPRKVYWQLAGLPLYKKMLWYSLFGYLQQTLAEIFQLVRN